jgi:hypothetical protein
MGRRRNIHPLVRDWVIEALRAIPNKYQQVQRSMVIPPPSYAISFSAMQRIVDLRWRISDQWEVFPPSSPSVAPTSMRTYAADDASISENLRRICSTEQRQPPLVAGVCALTIGKMQSECKLCAPDLPCFGCVKKRNPTAGVADCIICAGTSKPCPSR